MGSPAAHPPDRWPDRRPGPPGPRDVGERFAAHVGVRVGPAATRRCGCGAAATLTGAQAWSDRGERGDQGDDGPVPTGAVLALVDAAAREAAELALGGPDRPPTLVPVAAGVQYRMAAVGTLTATATVPCEGPLTDRADDDGVLRFSVAVDVADVAGRRVATGSVQWLATVTPPSRP